MKNIVLSLLLLLSTCTASAPLAAAPLADLPKMQEEMFEPSVQLGKFCSGTVIYSDRDKDTGLVNTVILTAKHCTEKVGQEIPVVLSVYNKANRLTAEVSYVSTVLGQSTDSDLALLKLKDQNTIFTVAAVAPKETGESLIFGQDTFSVSYPLGGSQTLTIGTLGRVEKIAAFGTKTTEFYRSTPDIGPGSSGSALFQNTTGKYELIGVLTGSARGFTFYNMYTPIEEIVAYLDVAKKVYEVNVIKTDTVKITK